MIITRFRRLATSSVLVIGLGASALAAQSVIEPKGQVFDPAKLAGGDYTLDPTHANVGFMVSHLGMSAYPGRFDSVTGSLTFNNADLVKSTLSVTIDAASVNVVSKKLTDHLQNSDFFDVKKYPEITFKSTKVEKIDDKTGRVTGDLSLHGVTKPVTLDVTFNGGTRNPMSSESILGFSARGEINRSDFGMTYIPKFVGDRVAIVIEAEFVQPKSKRP
ncbi:MAG: YceI family protein [Hyphomicrobiaceae bacterium]